jgi:Fe-S-cluster-containing dehydrogenase component/DMSO reductase anchor subunit
MANASSVVRLPILGSAAARTRPSLLEQYRREQQELTAVERFAHQHDRAAEDGRPAQERYYRDLLPGGAPREGQQYAFEVDLDACTGCKACVAACHSLNGLDEDEIWRSVGLLHGGTPVAPVQQAVTTACHHCLDPACMKGCPVGAYEKDPVTGIVKHLDDQCIGCQYCVFTCPYEVPRFNERQGIVRKCDMCADRLSAGEAPACVQGCPNEAIAIAVVDKRQVMEDAQGDAFLPGAPSPGITLPTTVYRTERALPRNMLPADFYTVRPSHAHRPLVLMLVLTQLSAGAFAIDAVASAFVAPQALATLRPTHALVALAVGLVALAASVFHLGRPQYAFRALLGLRTSWMSREILAFGLFAALAAAYAASHWQAALLPLLGAAPLAPSIAAHLQDGLCAAVAAAGAAGVTCSVFIYAATRRPWWSAPTAGFKFAMTAITLGLATTVLTFVGESALLRDAGVRAAVAAIVPPLATAILAASALKLAWELLFFRHLGDKQHTECKRTALLMRGDLLPYTIARFLAGALGGGVMPLVLQAHPSAEFAPALAGAMLLCLLAGELLERTLFFAAASSARMPGTLA